MSRIDSALEALYEDASLRDELRDDEANELLKWAESELARLDEMGADDVTFEEKTGELRKLLRGMNRFVGRRTEISAQAGDDSLVKLSEHASALGYSLSPDQLAQYGTQQATLDGLSAIQGLTRLISDAGQTAPDVNTPQSTPDVSTEQTPPADQSAEPDPAPAEPLYPPIDQLWGLNSAPPDPPPSSSEEINPNGT